jgi:hypothetical protein
MGSLGLVGEVFEVKTQVDHDLTTVSRVDRQLGLNKKTWASHLGDKFCGGGCKINVFVYNSLYFVSHNTDKNIK